MLVLSPLLVALLLVFSVEPSDQRTFCLHPRRWCKLLNSHPPKRSGIHSLVEPIIQNQGFLEHYISTWIPSSPVIRHLHRPHLVFCDGYLHLVVFVEFSPRISTMRQACFVKNSIRASKSPKLSRAPECPHQLRWISAEYTRLILNREIHCEH